MMRYPMMRYFGRAHDGYIYESEPLPTPAGQTCIICQRLITETDDGFQDVGMNVFHRDCFLRSIFGLRQP